MKRLPGLVVLLLAGSAVFAGCGGGSPGEATSRPCVVAEAEMADLLGVDEASAFPQKNGHQCLYASEGQAVVMLDVRTPAQFEAERAKFEDNGVRLPELVAADGFDGEANIDPRYNSLNVTGEGLVVSVQLVGTAPTDPDEQVDLETRIARAALEHL